MRRAPVLLRSAYTVGYIGRQANHELPAGAVAAATTAAARATAHLLVAVAAVDGLVAAWLERHARLVSAVGAGGSVHLSLAAITAVAAAAHRGLARGTALGAA